MKVDKPPQTYLCPEFIMRCFEIPILNLPRDQLEIIKKPGADPPSPTFVEQIFLVGSTPLRYVGKFLVTLIQKSRIRT